MEPVIWLVVFFTWHAGRGAGTSVTAVMEKVPQSSMMQCEANGAELKGLYSEVKFKCIEGVITSGVNQSVTQ